MVNLAKETIQSAANQLHVHGISAATIVQDMEALQKLHAVFVIDVKSDIDSPQHVSPNLNAYCTDSGVTDVGAAGVSLIKTVTAAEFEKLGLLTLPRRTLRSAACRTRDLLQTQLFWRGHD